MTVADLLVLALRVLPGEIREWLRAERILPGPRKDEAGTDDSVREDRGPR
jgi:hypothetical protein